MLTLDDGYKVESARLSGAIGAASEYVPTPEHKLRGGTVEVYAGCSWRRMAFSLSA
jgi:hypothetical protein